MDDEDLRSYAYLWDGSDPGWVVQLVSDTDTQGLPVHPDRGTVLIIEDDKEYPAVMAAMRVHGCSVVPSAGGSRHRPA